MSKENPTTKAEKEEAYGLPLIQEEFPSIDTAKASRAVLGQLEPCGIFRSPKGKFAITPIRQTEFSCTEAKDIAQFWLMWTGYQLVEYSNGLGFWAVMNAPAPRKSHSFTIEKADCEIDELRTKLAEAQAQLNVAKKIVKAVAPLAASYMNYQQSGQTGFIRWLVGCGDEQTERMARSQIVQLMTSVHGRELAK